MATIERNPRVFIMNEWCDSMRSEILKISSVLAGSR